MLEMFVVRETVFFLTGVMIGIGAIARLITGISSAFIQLFTEKAGKSSK